MSYCPVCGSQEKRENCARCNPRPMTMFAYTRRSFLHIFPDAEYNPALREYTIPERVVAARWPIFARALG